MRASRIRVDATSSTATPGVTPSVLQAIGHTPMIALGRLGAGLPARVLVKLESSNPGGSTKDRVGLAMVEEGERRGWLAPGGRSSRRRPATRASAWRWRRR